MAAYGRGDYGAGDYSIGAYFGAFSITALSQASAFGEKVKESQFEVYSSADVDIAAIRIISEQIVVVSSSSISVAGGVEAAADVDFVAQSSMQVQEAISKLYLNEVSFDADSSLVVVPALTIGNGKAAVVASSQMAISAREKWEIIPDVQTNWTTVS